MKCPDCKTKMHVIEHMNIETDLSIPCEPYYRCPRCKLEIDREDIDEMEPFASTEHGDFDCI